MRNIARAAAVVLALLPLSVFAQEATLPVPSNVTVEGVPPIPVALAEALASVRERATGAPARMASDPPADPDLDPVRQRPADSRRLGARDGSCPADLLP